MLPTSQIKSPTKAQIEAANMHKHEKAVKRDINKIDEALQNNVFSEMKALHINLDGKYQYCIADWSIGMYGYFRELGFNYEYINENTIRENLVLMRAKLEAFMHGWNAKSGLSSLNNRPDVNVTVNNSNTNAVNISLSFDDARQKIEDMTALSREQTDEILEKINELEEISKEKSSRKTKWEKVKPIIAFALDKGADVAVAILTLVVQMKLGL